MAKKPLARYLGPSDASDFFGVTPGAITRAMRGNGRLAKAVVLRDGKRRIDMEHAAAKAYRKGKRPAAKDSAPPPIVESDIVERKPLERKIRKYRKMTLDQILRDYGTLPEFADVVRAQKDIEAIHAHRLKSDQSTGELIPRAFVRTSIIGMVERVNLRLLNDLPASLSGEVFSACQTGATLEEVQELIHDAVSKELKSLKKDTEKEIRRAKG